MIIGALSCFISLSRADICLEDIRYTVLEARYYPQGGLCCHSSSMYHPLSMSPHALISSKFSLCIVITWTIAEIEIVLGNYPLFLKERPLQSLA